MISVSPVFHFASTFNKAQVQETVRKLCNDHDNLKHGLKILNVGFGLGMVSYSMCLRSEIDPPVSIRSTVYFNLYLQHQHYMS
jgi:hypothetical protein